MRQGRGRQDQGLCRRVEPRPFAFSFLGYSFKGGKGSTFIEYVKCQILMIQSPSLNRWSHLKVMLNLSLFKNVRPSGFVPFTPPPPISRLFQSDRLREGGHRTMTPRAILSTAPRSRVMKRSRRHFIHPEGPECRLEDVGSEAAPEFESQLNCRPPTS